MGDSRGSRESSGGAGGVLLGTTIPVGAYEGQGRSQLAEEAEPRTYPVTIEVGDRRVLTTWDLGDGEQTFDVVLRPRGYDTPASMLASCRVFVARGPLRIPAGQGVYQGAWCQISGGLFGQTFNIDYSWDEARQLLTKTGVRHKGHRPYSSWIEEVRPVGAPPFEGSAAQEPAAEVRGSWIPEGWPRVVPRIVAEGARELITFCREVFGATGEHHPERPATMRIGASVILISDAGGRDPLPAFLYVYVEDVDATCRRAIQAGALLVEAPADLPYGDRRCMITDAWGNTWQIASHRPAAGS